MTAQKLYDIIFNAAWESLQDNNGNICGDVVIPADDGSSTTIEIIGHYEIEGYFDNDYFSGTGAWVTTYAQLSIDDIVATATDNNGEEIENDITKLINEVDIESLETNLMRSLRN